LEEKDYRILLENQKSEPIGIMHDPASRKRWWMFRNDFYCEDEGYTAAAIKVLILDRIEQLEKKVSRAQARLTHNTISSSTLREPIPDDVKMFVWRRDGGKCVRCGNVVNLEYDHIIPIAKGGSNTARNIQLLCEKCNREKGANLFYRC
jgi:5-methylcytosine-specific restriction endonuclease McrA